MKDEIKEILDKLRSDDYYEKEYQKSVYYERDLKKLEDYMTNLSQKIEKLENDKRGMLVQLYKANVEKDNYKSKCEKAIEYIKNNTYKYRHDIDFVSIGLTKSKTKFINDLLNILQGGDKNEQNEL